MNLRKKTETFFRSPAGSTGAKVKKDLVPYIITLWSKFQLWRVGLLRVLVEFQNKRPNLAIPPEWADLWFLYKSVRERKPRVIWEFGSGCSTIALAYALWKNAKDGSPGFMYSMDQDKYWGGLTYSLSPSFLQKYYQLVLSPVTLVKDCYFRHSVLPEAMPNFAYLDSPSFESAEDRRKKFFRDKVVAVDMLDIEPRLPSDFFLVIDYRKPNTFFLKERFKRRYRMWRRKFVQQYIFELLE